MKWCFALLGVVTNGFAPPVVRPTADLHIVAAHKVAESDGLEARLRGAGLGNLGRDLAELRAARAAVARADAAAALRVCPFYAFAGDVDGAASEAEVSDVVFRQGSTFVVQKNETIDGVAGVSRYLLFKREDGRCDEEAVVRCSSVFARASPSRVGNIASKADFDHCHAQQCQPLPDLELSYAHSMLAGALMTVSTPGHSSLPKRGLLIGIGGGMIPLWVQEVLPETTLDAVDVAPEVLAAAPCFGLRGPEGGSNIQLALADGRSFLEAQPSGHYDFILVDAFMRSGVVPPCLSTREFVAHARERLAPGGVFVWNVWPHEFSEIAATTSAIFTEVAVGRAPGEGNRILVATKESLPKAFRAAQSGDAAVPDVRQWYAKAAFEKIAAAPLSNSSVRSDAKWCPSSGR